MTRAQADTNRPQAVLDASLSQRLHALATRLRASVLIEGAARVGAFVFLACVIQLLIDYFAGGLRWSIRAALTATLVAAVLWRLWHWVVAPLRLKVGPPEVANLLERSYPQLGSMLISAVRFSQGEIGPRWSNSPALMAAVVKDAGRRADKLNFAVVLNGRRTKRAAMALFATVLVSAGLSLAAPGVVGIWFSRNVLLQEVDWPKRTHLIVELDGDELIGARGDDLVVQAHAVGVQPRVVDIFYETDSGKKGTETMVTVGGEGAYHYRHTFKNAQEEFSFYLRGGDDRTKLYRARLLERPRITKTGMHIVPPAYARLPSTELGDNERVAQVLLGSEVSIWVETNNPVVQATLMAGRDTVAEASPDAEGHRVTFKPTATHTYHFALLDEAGLENRRPVRLSLRVTPDEPPRARMSVADAGDMITPDAILPITVEYADTYGLATAELVYEIRRVSDSGGRRDQGSPRFEGPSEAGAHDPTAVGIEGVIPLSDFKPYATTYTTSVEWPVAEEAVNPGAVVVLHARATDFDDVSGPNEARSPEVAFHVVTREELLSELARREQEYRSDFERLVDAQEELRRRLLTVLGQFQQRAAGEPQPSGRGDSPDPDRPRGLEAGGSLPTGSDDAALATDLAPLERRQRNIAGGVNVLRQQFEHILAEMRVNRLDTQDERERLGDRIIAPLSQLAKRDLPAAADRLRQWSRDASAETASGIDPEQVAILTQMRSILASMLQWEGYQEVVNMLRDIIRLQDELYRETQENLEEQAGDVFED